MKTIIARKDVPKSDQWDLSSLYATREAWEKDLVVYASYEQKLARYVGSLSASAEKVLEYLQLETELGILDEKLGYYAFLVQSTDAGNSESQDMQNRYSSLSVKIAGAASFFAPEILACSNDYLKSLLSNPILKDFHIGLEKLIRTKAHILSEAEEKILSLQSDAFQTPDKVFTALTDVDFTFGTIEMADGPIPLSHGSYGLLLQNQDRAIREKAYVQYYEEFNAHRHTLSNLYIGSIKQDVFMARVRKHENSISRALFPDNIQKDVYTNLISTVRDNIHVLHRYYKLRKQALKLEKLSLWDVKVPLVQDVNHKLPYEDAVKIVIEALAPLGKDYTTILESGLTGGWVDKYENQGKDSGAFSAGSFSGDPYILMNYKPDVVRDVFTLAHEAGHSMHSYYSKNHNHFYNYKYTIFEAEIASTCNEQLLFNHWYNKLEDRKVALYLLNMQIDDLLATLFRQTMFAEYELKVHEIMETTGALSLDALREEYKKLLLFYFGDSVEFHDYSDLEGLRIPHFYRAFYVYKYATGISAAIALSQGIIQNKKGALENYQNFLNAGGRYYPLENVLKAGVDMTKPEPIKEAINYFSRLLDLFEKGLA